MAAPPPTPTTASSQGAAFGVSWRERALVLGTLVSAVLCALVLGLLLAREPTLELAGLVPVSMFAAGKFLPLWGVTDRSHFGPYELGLVIWGIDSVTAVFWVYALDGLVRVRSLERPIRRVQEGAALVLEAYPGLRRAAVIGLIAFVLFPVAGTGAMAGTFIGVLLGLHRATLVAAVSAGGFLGGMAMAVAADRFAAPLLRFQAMQDDPLIKYGILAGVVALLVAAVWALNRTYKRALVQARARRDSAAHPAAHP